MAPGYRASGSSRRANRTNVANHDIFEGIPVRQWRRDYVTVAPQTTQETTTSQNDIWAVELPHGMPKDYLDLPQHSQDLLRAARSGKIYKRPAPVEEEEVDPELVGEKVDKKEDDPKEKGFTARAWKQVSREAPALDYLAKRRKGLVTAGSKPAVAAVVPTVTKATVRRTDAAGNIYVQDMVIPNGQKVEGEVISSTTIPDPSAPVPLVEVQPTPPRPRKPIKRKIKGPGRGRKKKMLPPTSAPPTAEGGVLAPTVEGAAGTGENNGIKKEGEDASGSGINEDTEMGDDSNLASDDDDGEEGDDGDDDEEGSPDIQGSPVKSTASPIPETAPGLQATPALQEDTDMSGMETDSPQPAGVERLKVDVVKAGSPLKHVALTTSNLNSPLPSPSKASDSTTNVDTSTSVNDLSLPTEDVTQQPTEELKDEPMDEPVQQEVQESTLPVQMDPVPEPLPEPISAPVSEPVSSEVLPAIEPIIPVSDPVPASEPVPIADVVSLPEAAPVSEPAPPVIESVPTPEPVAPLTDTPNPELMEASDLPPPPPQATEVHMEAAVEELREEVEEEKKILEVLEEVSAPVVEPEIHHEPEPATIAAPVDPIAPMEETEKALIEDIPGIDNTPSVAEETPAEKPEPASEAAPAAPSTESETKPLGDDIQDLLGNLERQLDG